MSAGPACSGAPDSARSTHPPVGPFRERNPGASVASPAKFSPVQSPSLPSGLPSSCAGASARLNGTMSEKVFEIVCPHCQTVIWVDGENRHVLRTEKAARKKESLDELLPKEKQKKDGMATKFEATAALEQEKLKKAREKFDKAFENKDED